MKKTTNNQRNLGVVTISLTFVAMAVAATFVMWPVTDSNIGFVLFATATGLLALAVAIIGRIDTLREFIKGFFNSI